MKKQFNIEELGELAKTSSSLPAGKFMVVGDLHASSTPPVSRGDDYIAAVFDKLNQINKIASQEECQAIFFLGDLLHIKRQAHGFINHLNMQLNRMYAPCFAIIGNHDEYNDDPDSLAKSPSGGLFVSGALSWMDIVQIGSLKIKGYDYLPEMALEDCGCRAALAHAFLSHDFSKRGLLDSGSIEKSGVELLFLGHDHKPYPPKEFGKCVIHRPGSVTRGSVHDYQMERVVQVAVADSETLEVKYHTLKVKKPEDIFRAKALIEKEERNAVDVFVKSMGESLASKEEAEPVEKVLRKLTDEEEVINFCVKYCRESGVL